MEKGIAFFKCHRKKNYGVLQLLLHLIFGWPAYLLTGSTGGIKYGISNHFWPVKPFSKALWPSIWTKKVWISDIGVALTIVEFLALFLSMDYFQ